MSYFRALFASPACCRAHRIRWWRISISRAFVSSGLCTPTLSALIESRKGITQKLDPPPLLIVAQPDVSLPGVWGESPTPPKCGS